MKKTLLLIAAVIISMAACKPDNTPVNKPKVPTPTINPSLLVGKWYYTLDTLKEKWNDGDWIIRSTFKLTDKVDYMQLDANGVCSYYNSNTKLTYSVKGNIITFHHPEIMMDDGNGGQVRIPAYFQDATIRSLTPTSLNILFYDVMKDNGGTYIAYEANYFEK